MKQEIGFIIKRFLFTLVSVLLIVFINNTCKKDLSAGSIPGLSTSYITDITQTSASCGANISSDGNQKILYRGVCWSLTSMPTISDHTTSDGGGAGSFVSTLTHLNPNTTYYVRAYATNIAGTGYGNEVIFTTKEGQVPTVTTLPVTNVNHISAKSGGTVSFDGGSTITAYGVCWGSDSTPTINNDKTIDGKGIGSFKSLITDLTPGTTYHLRAYASNNTGTGYGNMVSFSTISNEIDTETIYDIDDNIYQTVTIGDQVWMRENLRVTRFNDGENIPYVFENLKWEENSSAAYCWIKSYDDEFGFTFGALYNGYAVNSEKLCPVGWHVPDDEDWQTLINYLGNDEAGGKLKEAGILHWTIPNTKATNSTNFTGLPGGKRSSAGQFIYQFSLGYFWSRTQQSSNANWSYYLNYNGAGLYRITNQYQEGLSVRCIKN